MIRFILNLLGVADKNKHAKNNDHITTKVRLVNEEKVRKNVHIRKEERHKLDERRRQERNSSISSSYNSSSYSDSSSSDSSSSCDSSSSSSSSCD